MSALASPRFMVYHLTMSIASRSARVSTSSAPVALPVPKGPDNTTLTTWLLAAGHAASPAEREKNFRRLAQALSRRLHALAWRLTQDATAAEDILQEVLIKLWQIAPRWHTDTGQPGDPASGGGRSSVSAYVSRLVYTTAMDHHRRQRPGHISLESGGTTDADGDTQALKIPTPETLTATVQSRQQRTWLLGALKGIPERQQQAVVLSYFHEHSQAEVARAMHTTEKAVESLLVRARRTLAALLPGQLALH